MVFLAAPVTGIDRPSVRHPMSYARWSVLNRFILTVPLDRTGIGQCMLGWSTCDCLGYILARAPAGNRTRNLSDAKGMLCPLSYGGV